MQHSHQLVKLTPSVFVPPLRKSREEVQRLKRVQKKYEQKLMIYEDLLASKQTELDAANLEIFFLACNAKKIQELMVFVNEKIVKCECRACYETGRTTEAPFRQTEEHICKFSGSWEGILDTYQIKFQYHSIPHDSDDVQMMKDITTRAKGPCLMLDTDIVNVGYDDHWRNVALGRRVARGSNPFTETRNKIRHLLELPRDYRIPAPVAPDALADADEEPDDEEETQSPLLDLSAPGSRPPGSGPIALGRGNARI